MGTQVSGERPRLFRTTGNGNGNGTVRQALSQDGALLQPRVLRVRFSGDDNANILLRHGPTGGAADTDFLGPYYIHGAAGNNGEANLEFCYTEGTADVPAPAGTNIGRDLFYVVTSAGASWTVEIETSLR